MLLLGSVSHMLLTRPVFYHVASWTSILNVTARTSISHVISELLVDLLHHDLPPESLKYSRTKKVGARGF